MNLRAGHPPRTRVPDGPAKLIESRVSDREVAKRSGCHGCRRTGSDVRWTGRADSRPVVADCLPFPALRPGTNLVDFQTWLQTTRTTDGRLTP